MRVKEGPEVTFGYEYLKLAASRLDFFTKIHVALPVALAWAEMSPYPSGVQLGIRKHASNSQGITLRQLSILLCWAADRAQR
jgi:hypothetical protein